MSRHVARWAAAPGGPRAVLLLRPGLARISGARAARLFGAGSRGSGTDHRVPWTVAVRVRCSRRPPWMVPELALLPGGLLAGHATQSVVPLLAAAAGVVPLRRLRKYLAVRAESGQRAAAVIDLCTGLSGELRSGATPEQALHVVMGRNPGFRDTLGTEAAARLAAARYGAHVPAALRIVAGLPGGGGAASLAACWQVSSDSGTGLARGLDQLADALRAERALTEDVAGELAGPRTTAALLAVLPVFGLVLGTAIGANPLAVLLHTPVGIACLAAGTALEAAGLIWTGRIVRAAEDRLPPLRYEPRASAGGCGLSRHRAAGPDASGDERTPGRAGTVRDER